MPAPTAVAAADLVAGTGARSFAAVTTQAGDYLVVQVQVENDGTSGSLNSGMTPSGGGLTYTTRVDTTSDVAGSRPRIFIFTAPDAAGGSRTVTITPAGSGINYRARLTVVRGSAGPGAAAGIKTAQTISLARQGSNSMILMGVNDWSAGAVGTPVWTPGGATTASEQQAGVATYIFGRWGDSGAAATAAHGISSPSYTTPAVAALEMLGTASAAVTQRSLVVAREAVHRSSYW